KISARELGSRVSIHGGAQRRDALARNSESNCVRMSAVAGEQRFAGLMVQRIQQMESSDGPAGAVPLLSIARDHQRRLPVALDESRGADADHSSVPTVAIHHQAE